jgi:hypothetical protein
MIGEKERNCSLFIGTEGVGVRKGDLEINRKSKENR